MYQNSDISVFASSCETFGQILVEGIIASLPFACSNMSTMPEILGESCSYFDPLNPESIELSLLELINSHKLRDRFSQESFEKAQSYSWKKCTDNTFSFIEEIIKDEKNNRK